MPNDFKELDLPIKNSLKISAIESILRAILMGVDGKEKERIFNIIDKGYIAAHNNTDDEFIKDQLKAEHDEAISILRRAKIIPEHSQE